ncbi:MAG: exodeoxyribonuclease VII large subunit [Fimbriimonadaceae bacterium]|nr:exodeoxyribonuclease VII large subunit [Fimbriimonadaceae bacterium]
MSAAGAAEVLSVGALTAHLAALLRGDRLLSDCQVRGEVSNYHHHRASGHRYFKLKDGSAELKCALFRNDSAGLTFEPTEGLAVLARGRVAVYEARGEYQLYVRELQPDGLGALYAAFERLKQRLGAEGLFDEARKRPLPAYPRRVALLTSLGSAAVRDLLRVLRQRWPALRIVLIDALCQGSDAPASLIRGLHLANRCDELDLIVIGRGGGSIEDLWAFNDEGLARAVAASRVPLVSAVGHETDFTICDFVADLRAATPSHAAQLAVPDQAELQQRLTQLAGRAGSGLERTVAGARWRLEAVSQRAIWQRPAALWEPWAQRLDDLDGRLQQAVGQAVEVAGRRLERAGTLLGALDPTAVLQRGYAIVRRAADGRVALQPADLPPGTAAEVRLAGGSVAVTVGS